MKHRTLLLLVAGLALSGTVYAKSKSGAARKFVAEQVKTSVKDDVVVKPSKAQIAAAIMPTDLNRDGLSDFVADYSKFTSPAWCGTGGCRYQLWLGRADKTAKIVFDQQIREVKTRQGSFGTIFDFDFHGGVCGKTGAEACPISFVYDTPSGFMTAVPIPGKKKVERRTDPIDPMYSEK